VTVFKKVKKTQHKQTYINQCTVIQPFFCGNIHNGRDALNYFGSRQVTEFSQQLPILNPTIGFQVSVGFRISEKVTDSVGFGCGCGIRHIPTCMCRAGL